VTSVPDEQPVDASRRTRLAAERTWLAWWRTGIGAAAVAVGVGRLLPAVTSGPHWLFALLGSAYAAVAVAVLIAGAVRQRRVEDALDSGVYERLSSSLVLWLTAAGVALSLLTLAVIIIA
jgi:putative membrane protein